jgi:AraC-like DNA-binding protein
MKPVPSRITPQLLIVVTVVKDHIDNHPLDWKSIDNFSDMAGINRKLLQRVFKAKYGMRISDYQLTKRMQAAEEMLQEARLSLKQISGKCGYHSPNNFSRAFKKVYKCSPSEWQNNHLNTED